MMSIKQQINLKFFVYLEKTPTEALCCFKKSMVMTWCEELGFLNGIDDSKKKRRGRPSTNIIDENVDHVEEKVWNDRSLNLRMIADELSMYSERVWEIWRWGRSSQKWCWGSWMKSKRSSVYKQMCQDILKQLILLLAISPGSLSTTQHLPNGSALNKEAHCHQDPKKQGCSSPKPRYCWLLFLIPITTRPN